MFARCAAARSSDVAKAVAEALYKDLLLVHELHEGLTDVLLAGEGVSGVARSLAGTLNVGIVITDRSHFLLAQTNLSGIEGVSTDDRGCLPQSLISHPDVRAAILRSSTNYKVCGSKITSPSAANGSLYLTCIVRLYKVDRCAGAFARIRAPLAFPEQCVKEVEHGDDVPQPG